jgi:hypothetical protein
MQHFPARRTEALVAAALWIGLALFLAPRVRAAEAHASDFFDGHFANGSHLNFAEQLGWRFPRQEKRGSGGICDSAHQQCGSQKAEQRRGFPDPGVRILIPAPAYSE